MVLVTPWAGCLILVVCTILVTFFDFSIHSQHAVVLGSQYCLLYCNYCSVWPKAGTFTKSEAKFGGTMPGGQTTAGDVLSLIGTVYGFATDGLPTQEWYTVYQREMPTHLRSLPVFLSVCFLCFLPWFWGLLVLLEPSPTRSGTRSIPRQGYPGGWCMLFSWRTHFMIQSILVCIVGSLS